jgi:hypothetical protein
MQPCRCGDCAGCASCALQVARQVKRSVTRRMLANNNATAGSNTARSSGAGGGASPASPKTAAAAACETDTPPLTTHNSAVEAGPEQEDSTSSSSAVELPVIYKQVGRMMTGHGRAVAPAAYVHPCPSVMSCHASRKTAQAAANNSLVGCSGEQLMTSCPQTRRHAWLAVTCAAQQTQLRSSAARQGEVHVATHLLTPSPATPDWCAVASGGVRAVCRHLQLHSHEPAGGARAGEARQVLAAAVS